MIVSGSDLGVRRRRALWRATHRGTKEMDFLLGRFAKQTLDGMDVVEIAVLERLIDTPDPEIEQSFYQGPVPRRAGPRRTDGALASFPWLERSRLDQNPRHGVSVKSSILAGRAAAAGAARRSPPASPKGSTRCCSAELARAGQGPILHIARDGNRLATLEEALAFFAPDVTVLSFPAWDSVPYDRVAPNAEIVAQRIATLAQLIERGDGDKKPLIVLTTVNAALQRVPPREFLAATSIRLQPGNALGMQELIARLETSGYARAGTVTDPGPICGARRHSRSLSARRPAGPPRFLRRHARIRSGPSIRKRSAPLRASIHSGFCP